MKTENLSTLEIHKLTKEQYEREKNAGNLNENALYLTPGEEIDFDQFVTDDELQATIQALSGAIDSKVPNTRTINDKTLSEDISLTAADVGAQPKITGTAGQFVVIGDDGNVTTKTVPNAEEASF